MCNSSSCFFPIELPILLLTILDILHIEVEYLFEVAFNFVSLDNLHFTVGRVIRHIFVGEGNDSVSLLGVLSQHLMEVSGNRLLEAKFKNLLWRALDKCLVRLIETVLADDTHSLKLGAEVESSN